MKRINLYSNLDNGAGLEKDCKLLTRLLQARGHQVNPVPINGWRSRPFNADVNIFVEIVEPEMLNAAPQNWLIPNSEWWGATWDLWIPRFNKILCKTKDAYRIWSQKAGQHKCVFTSWESEDMYRPALERRPTFLHLAGKSETKNTAAVLEAWKSYGLPFPLIVSAFKPEIVRLCYQGGQNGKLLPNVTQVDRFSDEQVIETINRCQFHIMPSKYEGFGHAIHQALSCGGIVITTNAPPMRDFPGIAQELLIPVQRTDARPPAVFNIVHSMSVAQKCRQAMALSASRIAELSKQAREGFLDDQEFFREQITGVFDAASL